MTNGPGGGVVLAAVGPPGIVFSAAGLVPAPLKVPFSGVSGGFPPCNLSRRRCYFSSRGVDAWGHTSGGLGGSGGIPPAAREGRSERSPRTPACSFLAAASVLWALLLAKPWAIARGPAFALSQKPGRLRGEAHSEARGGFFAFPQKMCRVRCVIIAPSRHPQRTTHPILRKSRFTGFGGFSAACWSIFYCIGVHNVFFAASLRFLWLKARRTVSGKTTKPPTSLKMSGVFPVSGWVDGF